MSLFLGVAAFLAFSQTVPAGPQGAATGQVERSLRRVEEPAFDPPAPRIYLPGPRTSKPPPAKRVKVTRIFVTGNQALTLGEIRPALPEPGELALADLYRAADEVTALYRARGFPLAYAYLPEGEAAAGEVEIAVVEGRIGRVWVEGNAHFSSDFILDHLGDLRGPSEARLEDLERSLLLLNEIPSLRVEAWLRPGETPGTTDLRLMARDQMPLTLDLDVDNFGSELVGETRAGLTFGFHDLWGAGHGLSLRGRTALDAEEGELESGGIEYMVPFRTGTRLTLRGMVYDYEGRSGLTVLDPAGDGAVFGGTLSHAFVRGTDFSLWGDAGLEVKNLRQELIGIDTVKDELRILILGARADLADGWAGRWVASLRYLQGLGGVAGGLDEDDPNASRPGADGEFSAFTLRLHRLQRVAPWMRLIGRFDAQYAREPLVVSEQFVLGGHDSIRGYPPFEFMGDRGYTATVEARFKAPFLDGAADPFEGEVSAFDIFQVAAFVDTGEMIRERPLAGERRKQVLTGGGVGFLIDYPGAIHLRFDVAWPLTEVDPSDDDDVTFYLSILFTLR